MKPDTFWVYIVSNKARTVLYIGVTNDLERRIEEHRRGTHSCSFTARYRLNRLVFYQRFREVRLAIGFEKKLKGWARAKKNALIARHNPAWDDLAVTKLGMGPPPDGPFRHRGRERENEARRRKR